MPPNTRIRTRGNTLLITIFSLAIIGGMSGAVFLVTSNNLRAAKRHAERSAAMAYADGLLENLFDQWRHEMISAADRDDRIEGPTTEKLAEVLDDPSLTLSAPEGLSLTSWSVQAANPYLQPMEKVDDRPQPESGSTSKMRARLNYVGRVTVQFNSREGDNVTVERSFVRGGRNLFDDFLFSTQKKTEIHPGAPMYMDRSQINGDVYMAHDFLHLLSSFIYTGQLSLDYRDNDPGRPDPVIANNGTDDNWNPNRPPRQGPEQKLFDTQTEDLEARFLNDQTDDDQSADGNPNNDGFHELIEKSVDGHDDPLRFDSETSERLADNADYVIEVDKNNNVKIFDGSGTQLTSGDARTAILAALTTNQAIKDAREQDYVRLVTLDVSKIKAGVDSGAIRDNVKQDGLLIYMQDTSDGQKVTNTKIGGTGSNVTSWTRGIRLLNGASLPSIDLGGGVVGGFTVASPNAVYIQGDYNTGTTPTKKPQSNNTSPYTTFDDDPENNPAPKPVAGDYERVPSAVAGDAVNVLSNNWKDVNSTESQSKRPATNTTVNTAIIAGNVPTDGVKDRKGDWTGSYSGGIENFVRFHEKWADSGKDYFTIHGALALLYASNQATGKWNAADYDPPNRRWFYDTLFHEQNPPGIQAARSYDRGRWTMR